MSPRQLAAVLFRLIGLSLLATLSTSRVVFSLLHRVWSPSGDLSTPIDAPLLSIALGVSVVGVLLLVQGEALADRFHFGEVWRSPPDAMTSPISSHPMSTGGNC